MQDKSSAGRLWTLRSFNETPLEIAESIGCQSARLSDFTREKRVPTIRDAIDARGAHRLFTYVLDVRRECTLTFRAPLENGAVDWSYIAPMRFGILVNGGREALEPLEPSSAGVTQP